MKRLIAWTTIIAIAIVLTIVIFGGSTDSYHPVALEEKLSTTNNLYLASDNDQFGVPGFEYGGDFSTSVEMLQLKDWFTDEKIQDVLADAVTAKGECNVRYSDTDLVFTAFGGKCYTLGFHLSRSLKCYMLDFVARFEDPQITGVSSIDPTVNHMSYKDSCQYFYQMIEEFETAYGKPIYQDITKSLEDAERDSFLSESTLICNYATWKNSGSYGTSVLHLYACPIRISYLGTDVLTLAVYVYVGSEIPGVSFESLVEELPK